MTVDRKHWIISDTHWGHDNIIKLCDRPLDHEERMFENWERLVNPNDEILHLGDVWWQRSKRLKELKDRIRYLPGRKKLILGNHDDDSVKEYEKAGFLIVNPLLMEFGNKLVYFTHRPDGRTIDWDINVHGHIHNNGYNPKFEPLVDYSPQADYRNIAVELTDYGPIRLDWVLNDCFK